jgi:hypothetical protein
MCILLFKLQSLINNISLFYFFTDFDCILTNLSLIRVDKGKFRLPSEELQRTKSILTRALAVEKGSEKPEVSETHPDGLDLSLFKDQVIF